MHYCPFCGFECDCNGDIDDAHVMSQQWINKNCIHPYQCQLEREETLYDDDQDEVDENLFLE